MFLFINPIRRYQVLATQSWVQRQGPAKLEPCSLQHGPSYLARPPTEEQPGPLTLPPKRRRPFYPRNIETLASSPEPQTPRKNEQQSPPRPSLISTPPSLSPPPATEKSKRGRERQSPARARPTDRLADLDALLSPRLRLPSRHPAILPRPARASTSPFLSAHDTFGGISVFLFFRWDSE